MVVKAPGRSIYSRPPPVAIGSSTPTPWLVLTHGRHGQIQTFYNPLDGSIHHRSIPEMRQKYCFGCSNGHLLMLDLGSRECYLLSLTSMETFPLPSLTADSIWYERIFVLSSGAPNQAADCTVIIVKVSLDHGEYMEHLILICKPYEKEWRILCRINAYQFGSITSGIPFSDGKVYLHSSRNKLMLVDTRSLQTQEIDVEEIDKCSGYLHKQTLFQSSSSSSNGAGDLLLVIANQTLSENFHSAQVYRLNNSNSTKYYWERLESINDKGALFLGDIGAAYLVNDQRVKNGRIYFMRSSVNGMSWNRFALAESDIIMHKLFRPNPFRICYKSTYLAMAAIA